MGSFVSISSTRYLLLDEALDLGGLRGDAPLMGGQVMLDHFMVRHCYDMQDAISDGSLQVARIVDLTTRVVSLLVVWTLGSTMTHHITGVQMRLVE